MIIKKFQAGTETEAILLAKDELGKDAIVMNIKTISPRGVYRLFRKPVVEVTAAIDEAGILAAEKKETLKVEKIAPKFNPNLIYDNSEVISALNISAAVNTETREDTSAIEKKLNNLQELLETQLREKQTNKRELVKVLEPKSEEEEKKSSYMQLVYNQLVKNEVDEIFVNQIIGEIENKFKKDTAVDNILSNVYQKIVLKLGQPKTIEVIEGKTKFVFFIGPTGVGKTTTIAKIASDLKINKKAKIAMLTSDTYRIAAVEQLRTYANILSVPMKVIYTEEEIIEAKKELNDYDIVLVDTAGRSHKNREQRDDLEKLIHTVEEEEREIYLVLSATTKYKDLTRITECYSEITNYRLIFTKLDETISVGNILNIKMLTSADLSYAAYGQNVPDDISKIDTQETAKKLLGGND
ncbi:flagellar biosynthesis regulator FlhF [Anaerocolumna cellulosilytica]|uniref:Flagellar biosynthesis protein FlhF n=1 Tax=Anaerocolumna cellulosilytica TaxID=433286 RepID=A0A6S6R565_9FIRM|nr:flagellar biosynthesis protein FlhF [Anaerocolumna cellulosilytica]MBB5197013.1 flagellar biosynthesis protein FlhF [Anaerocolumna cellulosilytica]BCJ95227.1 flagellar biosynthesis regulator FlhF [Anaerocolumna cellulosilytica]